MATNLNEEYLKTIYYNPKNPASYSSASKLHKKALHDGKYISQHEISNWLKAQSTNTSFKELKRNFKTRRVYVPHTNYLWDLDVCYMKTYSEYNKYNYFLLCIDILSRYVYTYPLITLKGSEMCVALKHIFSKSKPLKARTDKGSEFIGYKVENLFKKLDIIHFTTTSQFKANYSERAIKTIKMKITKFIYHKQNYKWDSVLQDITDSYNSSYHRMIHTTPTIALTMESQDLWLRNYNYDTNPNNVKTRKTRHVPISSKYGFIIGDKVKISRIKTVFQRAYSQTYTDEVFIVSNRYSKDNLAIYILKDWNNEIINGRFYESEISKVKVDENSVFKIDKILKTKMVLGEKIALISWLGWSKKFNSWIPFENIENYADTI